MKGLDLSHCKKIAQDKASAKFRHPDGHEVHVAISALSPSMKKKLMEMPLHQAEPEAPVEAPEQEEAADDDQPEAPAAAVEQTPQAAPVAAPVTQQAAPEAGPVTAPNWQDNAAASDQPTAMPAHPPPPTKEELDDEDLQYQKDLARGAIKPETYRDLFAKKDTLGKIGTIFGMMLSGGGSALSGQPDAFMDMMNKVIDRDLEAQKATKEGARNFLQLHYAHDLQNAQIRRSGYENQNTAANTALTQAQTAGVVPEIEAKIASTERARAETKSIPVENKLKTAQANALNAQNAGLAALNGSKNKMLSTTFQELSNLSDTMPQSTQPQAKAVLQNVMAPAITKQIQENNAKTSLQTGLNTQAANAQEEQFKGKINKMLLTGDPALVGMAKDLESKHVPGIPGQASIALNPADREQINSGVTFQNQLKRFTDWTKSHSGDLSPSDRKEGEALAAQLQGAYRQATHGGVYKEGEQGFISNIIDSTPTKFFNKVRVLPSLKAVQSESAAQLDQFLKSKGFQGGAGAQPAQAAGQPNVMASQSIPIERMTPDGKTALFDPASKKFLGYKGAPAMVGSK